MKRCLIIGATGGIGGALLEAAPGDAIGLSRKDGFDLRDPNRIGAGLAQLDGVFDFVMLATGALVPNPDGKGPEKSLAQIDGDAMADLFWINTIGPALVLAGLAPLLPRDRPSAIGVLSARVGSIEDNRLGGWHSYRASKAALNQIIRGASIEYARTRPQAALVALHPGTVATDFTKNYTGRDKFSPEHAASNLWRVLMGCGPEDSGRFMDYAGQEIPW